MQPGIVSYEAHVPTQQPAPQTNPWVSCTHGDQKWTADSGSPSRQRAQTVDCLAAGVCERWLIFIIVQSHRFERAKRLRHKFEFDAVYRRDPQVQRSADPLFAVLARLNGSAMTRLGLSVPSRQIRNAVGRNRVKRLIRESFRLQQERLPHADIVVNVRAAAAQADNIAIAASLEQHWRILINKCARS
jgi:ribonuclease P protein component